MRDKVGRCLQAAATSNRTSGGTAARSEASCSSNRGSDRYRRQVPGRYLRDLAYQASKHLHILVSGWWDTMAIPSPSSLTQRHGPAPP
jgi:hypothetical protein